MKIPASSTERQAMNQAAVAKLQACGKTYDAAFQNGRNGEPKERLHTRDEQPIALITPALAPGGNKTGPNALIPPALTRTKTQNALVNLDGITMDLSTANSRAIGMEEAVRACMERNGFEWDAA